MYVVDNPYFPEAMTPDRLTFLRLMIGVLLWVLYFGGPAYLRTGFVIGTFFTIGAVSDLLDGPIARTRGITTVRGAFWDPAADKVLVLAVVTHYLWAEHSVLVLCIGGAEVISQGLRILALRQGYDIRANDFGKYKTTVQVIGIYAFFFGLATVGLYTLLIAFGLGLASVSSHVKERTKIF